MCEDQAPLRVNLNVMPATGGDTEVRHVITQDSVFQQIVEESPSSSGKIKDISEIQGSSKNDEAVMRSAQRKR